MPPASSIPVQTLAPAPSVGSAGDVRGWAGDVRLETLFNALGSVATLPDVALRVIEVAEDEYSSAAEMTEVLAGDQTLTTRLLQLVNSAAYGMKQPVGDLQTAVTALGMKQVRDVAMTVIVGRRFRNPCPLGDLDWRRLWAHSVGVAAAARCIAKGLALPNTEEAYVAGLIHDLGLSIIDQCMGSETPRVMVRFVAGEDWLAAERDVLGFDHAELGAYVARRSRLPEGTVEAIALHHDPLLGGDTAGPLTAVLALANYFATRASQGAVAGRRVPLPDAATLRLGLGPAEVRGLWDQVAPVLARAAELSRLEG